MLSSIASLLSKGLFGSTKEEGRGGIFKEGR
jgi:hypothetical protein